MARVSEQIELWPCGYPNSCRAETLPHVGDRAHCLTRASAIVRYLDEQGRPLRQVEVCERHAREMMQSVAVRDMRWAAMR